MRESIRVLEKMPLVGQEVGRIKIDRRRQVDIGMKHGLEIPGRCETHEKHFDPSAMKPIMSVIWPL